MDNETLAQKEAERLTAEIQKMSIKYDDFDDMKTLEFMKERGITSIPQAYKQMGGNLDFEDSMIEELHGTRQEKFTRITKDNFKESLQSALYSNPEDRPTTQEPSGERPTKENFGKMLLDALKGEEVS